MRSQFNQIEKDFAKLIHNRLEKSPPEATPTINVAYEMDAEHDDIEAVAAIKAILQKIHAKFVTKIGSKNLSINFDIIANRGNAEYAMPYEERNKVLNDVTNDVASGVKVNIIPGAANNNAALEKRAIPSNKVKNTLREADILLVSAGAFNLIECLQDKSFIHQAQLMILTGAFNSQESVKYIIKHHLSDAEINAKQKIAEKQLTAEHEKATAELEKAKKEADKEKIEKANKKVAEAEITDKKITELAQRIAAAEKFTKMCRDISYKPPILLQAFPFKSAFGKKYKDLKQFSVSLDPNFYPIFSALIAAASTNGYGTEIGALFAEGAAKANAGLIAKWAGKFAQSEAIRKQFNCENEESARDLFGKQALQKTPEKLKAMMEPVMKNMDEDARRKKFGKLSSTLTRYNRIIQYVFQTLISDQFIPMMLGEVFGVMPPLLTNMLSSQKFNDEVRRHFPQFSEDGEVEKGGEIKEASADTPRSDVLHFAPRKKDNEEEGTLNVPHFIAVMEVMLVQALYQNLLEPGTELYNLIEKEIASIDLSQIKDLDKLTASVKTLGEKIKPYIEQSLRLRAEAQQPAEEEKVDVDTKAKAAGTRYQTASAATINSKPTEATSKSGSCFSFFNCFTSCFGKEEEERALLDPTTAGPS